jgi:hypothetical protein
MPAADIYIFQEKAEISRRALELDARAQASESEAELLRRELQVFIYLSNNLSKSGAE